MSTWADPLQHLIASEHQEACVYALFDSYIGNAGNPEVQKTMADQLCWQIARHSAAEELLIYPLFEKFLGEDDHQLVKQSLFNLSKTQFGTPAFDDLLTDIVRTMKIHSETEESSDLPMLLALLPQADSQLAIEQFTLSKQFAPIYAPSGKVPIPSWTDLIQATPEQIAKAFQQLGT
ncbi:hypothetical protein CC1G_07511 [Coprinopsis cinerea okayama7|uniref:Hemerythrin-like domain-containing protein n=1 Tax=Coprinopsis cinerea (strain Okayama-7 / 130 / ATCC MYA-4618 / FGSC 9003) TaxID=240176 RepID=A8P145_COPC7|nr:hypothetical protein CC1G_07511 [Coprinopsis cinerea okayama7\|eukprot:XP_001838021.2 hypothetical protein CC1G_07511 [Coprinopsis cinerea okayama7\